MQTNLTWFIFLQHLGVSLIPWLIVLLVGGGLGYLLATLFHRWFKHHPGAEEIMVLFPWRSLAIFAAFAVIHSSLMAWNFGLPTLVTSNSIAVELFVLFVPWVTYTFLNSWHPAGTRSQVFSLIRTFTVLSLVLPVFLQTAGLGYYIYMAAYWFNVPHVTLGYEVVGAMMFGADLIIGLIQYLLALSRKAASA
jgi:hypothetical protein